MKILFVSSEVTSFCKTGGLGDVAGSLPLALKTQGDDVRVILPLYEAVGVEWRRRMKKRCSIQINLSWRRQLCSVFELEHNSVTYYFVDNEYYFKRRELYGHYDDGERFAFFSRTVLEVLPSIDFIPDVIHANDWETALVPIYLRLSYSGDTRYENIKTVFTIHNIEYQGHFHRDFLADVAGIDDEHFRSGLLAYNDGICLMKGAIICADFITTVSPSYAQEIKTPYYGHGLDAILRDNEYKLRGVLNGIDMDDNDPSNNTHLFRNYSVSTLEDKAYNKTELQTMLGLKADTSVPVIAIVTRLTEHKGIDLIGAIFDDLMGEAVNVVVLGKGDWRYEQMFEQMKRKYPGKVSVNILFSSDLATKIYAGADIMLMPSKSEPCGLAQMIAMRYGTVPVVRETGGLRDTVFPYREDTDEGNGFTFKNYNAHDMLYTIRRAIAMYNDGDLWRKLMVRGMTGDYSWGRSAGYYLDIYKSLK